MADNSKNTKSNDKNTNKSPHAGHRQRVFSKYLEHGLTPFEEHEVLELLLFFSIPRSDTNVLAHKLIEEFGSLENIIEASPEDLLSVEGVGKNTATLISLFRNVWEYKNTHLYSKRIRLCTTEEICRFCQKYFYNHVEEEAIMLLMDNSNRLKSLEHLSKGSVNETAFQPGKIVKKALLLKSPKVVIAHNHPGGVAEPSSSDKKLTKILYSIMKGANINLLDHIVCSGDFFTSFRQRGFFDEYDNNI